VNAYKVKAGIGVITGKLCDPCLRALSHVECQILQKERYINLLTFTYPSAKLSACKL